MGCQNVKSNKEWKSSMGISIIVGFFCPLFLVLWLMLSCYHLETAFYTKTKQENKTKQKESHSNWKANFSGRQSKNNNQEKHQRKIIYTRKSERQERREGMGMREERVREEGIKWQ